jgi:membrane protein DedA with SNARE-associated domain
MPISTYGYIAIAVGTFLEGETVLVMGGLAAHRGYLELPWVMVWGFLGTLFGDQLYFYIGRIKGISFLEKRPYWKSRSGRVFDLMHKHQLLLIFSFVFFTDFARLPLFSSVQEVFLPYGFLFSIRSERLSGPE